MTAGERADQTADVQIPVRPVEARREQCRSMQHVGTRCRVVHYGAAALFHAAGKESLWPHI